jgi:hypothetical protein
MAWTRAQIKQGGWKPETRFVEEVAYVGAIQERDSLRTERDTLAEALREIAAWECECDMPEPGEDGVILCFGCRARAALKGIS